MTIKELSELHNLNREIDALIRRIKELKMRALPGAARVTDMPRSVVTSDITAEIAVEIAEAKARLEADIKRRRYERARLEYYIASVTDSRVRQIMRYRFVDGLSWTAVAHRMGGGNTASGCLMNVKRYLLHEGRQ